MANSERVLEFDKIKELLQEYAHTIIGKKQAGELKPLFSEQEVNVRLRETTEARCMIEKMGNPPIAGVEEAAEFIEIGMMGGCLTGEQLERIANALTAVSRIKGYLCDCKQLALSLPYYEENLNPLDEIRDEIGRTIRGGRVDDYASKALRTLRADIEKLTAKMREKAEASLRTYKAYVSEQFCTERSGHICIPVKKEYKSKVSGSVIDQSATGSTFFIEPAQVAKYAEELSYAKLEEENEVRRILYSLTGIVADQQEVFAQNQRTIEKLDFIFAKGKLSLHYAGTKPEITTERNITISQGRHPLMEEEVCVPLDFTIGNGVTGIIITGPNTGGKTVAIKTVGLNCMMAQSGLHVSCEKAEICMNSQILCDIGDGQNISENLSTFSAHITNVLDILSRVNKESLVIMDELGSGTDPTEGMGIAIAILEELRRSEALFLVTTHYPEVKNYAGQTEGVLNARMAFNKENLQPLYQMEIGAAGESCAFHIAKRLGMPGTMLKRAAAAAYGSEASLGFSVGDDYIQKQSTVKLQKKKKVKANSIQMDKFAIGDSVMVYPEKKIGIVCEKVNEKGVLRIQMQDRKIYMNQKRIKLHVKADELYPEDYDFSIIFDSVADRKARHTMERKYDASVEIVEE